MSDKEDDKPVISLAAKRDEANRDFAKERSEIVKELLELGLSKDEATAGADEVQLCDWLAYRAVTILDHWERGSPEALVKLIEIMRRGIDDRLQNGLR